MAMSSLVTWALLDELEYPQTPVQEGPLSGSSKPILLVVRPTKDAAFRGIRHVRPG
jgi:hypothetical protein